MKKNLVYVFIIILIILSDQAIKNQVIINGNGEILSNILKITYTENTGGAFNIGEGNINFLIIANILILGILTFLSIHLNKGLTLSISLIIAGGLGNLIDRIIRGFVVDYIDITNIISFPIFNLADIFIVIGTIILIIQIFIKELNNKE